MACAYARSPATILARALSGRATEQAAALRFVAAGFINDHMELVPKLMELATQSHRWAAYARQAFGAARRDRLIPVIRELVPPLLNTADCDDYRRMAELLAHIQAWELLGQLSRRALASADPGHARSRGRLNPLLRAAVGRTPLNRRTCEMGESAG